MPFVSKRQQRFMFAAESRGELPQGMAKRWARHTKNIKKLPEKVAMSYELGQAALKMAADDGLFHRLLKQLNGLRVNPATGHGLLGVPHHGEPAQKSPPPAGMADSLNSRGGYRMGPFVDWPGQDDLSTRPASPMSSTPQASPTPAPAPTTPPPASASAPALRDTFKPQPTPKTMPIPSIRSPLPSLKSAASGCGSMTAKKKKYRSKMSGYLQHLTSRVQAQYPAQTKQAAANQLHKLATAFASSGNLIDAMRVSHPNLTDPVRHKLAAALVRNCLAHDKRSTVMLGTAAPARTPAKAPSSTSTVPAAGGVSALAAAGA
jgi:hypothetical protein